MVYYVPPLCKLKFYIKSAMSQFAYCNYNDQLTIIFNKILYIYIYRNIMYKRQSRYEHHLLQILDKMIYVSKCEILKHILLCTELEENQKRNIYFSLFIK